MAPSFVSTNVYRQNYNPAYTRPVKFKLNISFIGPRIEFVFNPSRPMLVYTLLDSFNEALKDNTEISRKIRSH